MPLGARTSEGAGGEIAYAPVAFAALPGWDEDDHLAALQAFARSATALACNAATPAATGRTHGADARLVALAEHAANAGIVRPAEAKTFFEQNFVAHRVIHDRAPGLLTGYYEPVLPGARAPSATFPIPVYRRPPDLVNLVGEEERGALADGLTHARRTAKGIAPYDTRAEIEAGALAGQGLELMWLADPVDTFFMHVQGSGRIRLADGTTASLAYDGKNGHPYTSIGRVLIDAGDFTPEEMSLAALKVWLSADADRGRRIMQENRSFIFFRELGPEEEGPLGAFGIPLSPGRSLAVDTAFHAIGTPVYVDAPTLCPWTAGEGFRRLMIGQDVGSAIRGPERGDIYFGSGDAAGRRAGATKHPGTFYVLLPEGADAP